MLKALLKVKAAAETRPRGSLRVLVKGEPMEVAGTLSRESNALRRSELASWST
jgi:hypothetical protein